MRWRRKPRGPLSGAQDASNAQNAVHRAAALAILAAGGRDFERQQVPAHSLAWQTASTLLPSGSWAKAA
jgi:hypothetical protein